MGSAWWQCAACLRTQEEDICELQLNHCNLYDVPPDVFIYERTLEKLYLDANRIKDLPRPLFQCHELRVLSLSDNEVSILPPAIASLINLEYLDLSKNNIKELPDSIKECKNLRSIDISVNPFERFPDAITHIVGLRELYINDAYIEYLPANFGRLSALKTLELRENNMMTLPKSMSRLVNLQRLDIGNNDFTELPEVVGDLINLTELWIDGNDIRRIPNSIEQLYCLNHFDCTMNAVHIIPSEIQGWRDISIMNLSSNEIYELPDTLCYLRTIVILKIDDNQLNSLPNEIGQMSSLEELIVTKNFLEYLPSSIGLLRKLHCLNADNNYLRCLPPEIGSCTALSLLSLRSNNLITVPPELGHLSSLRVLNLVNNCIKFLPVSMLNLTNLKALWLSDNQSQPLVPLQQDFNCEEDMMVLSCFMLPQKPRQDLEKVAQAVGPISNSIIGNGKRICFAAEVDTEIPRQLHRAPTPYPKELRNLARHARNLHHQSIHDQRMHSEQEAMVKEAVIAKSMPLDVTQNETCFPENSYLTLSAGSCDFSKPDVNSPVDSKVNNLNSEGSSEEVNRTVLAKQKSPDIREAKYIRNPTSDYHTTYPTIADYVSSTWKPDEYSKANTAKIVESEKLTDSYRMMSTDKTFSEKSDLKSSKTNDIPLAPPPYHIAAAFSKKAALFQQFNQVPLLENQPVVTTPNSSQFQNSEEPPMDNQLKNSETYINTQNSYKFTELYPNEIISNGAETLIKSVNDNKYDSSELIDETDANNTYILNSEQLIDSERFSKPSRIPISKAMHLENINSNNGSTKKCKSFNDNQEMTSVLDDSNIPTSPITGRKYRSPISMQLNKFQDRTKGIVNGSISHDDTFNEKKHQESMNPVTHLRNVENQETSNKSSNKISPISNFTNNKCEVNSGRSTPSSISNSQNLENKNCKNLAIDEMISADQKPKLKWMFGPHRNANVLPVQIRKNPGLGFSIAGGITGAETGIIVTKVNPDGPAQGTLRPGDKILEVDGIDFTKSDHNNAVAVLRATGAVVSMMISRHQ